MSTKALTIEDRAVLVTGANRGIGQALVRRQHGAPDERTTHRPTAHCAGPGSRRRLAVAATQALGGPALLAARIVDRLPIDQPRDLSE
jgi:NAD(P)-dependent dehydrogenase (short-subunit alcohol dehydrogenase family)